MKARLRHLLRLLRESHCCPLSGVACQDNLYLSCVVAFSIQLDLARKPETRPSLSTSMLTNRLDEGPDGRALMSHEAARS